MPVPGRTVTRSGWPSTTMLRITGGGLLLGSPRRKLIGIGPLPVQHIQAGGGLQRRELAAAQPAGPVLLPVAAVREPR